MWPPRLFINDLHQLFIEEITLTMLSWYRIAHSALNRTPNWTEFSISALVTLGKAATNSSVADLESCSQWKKGATEVKLWRCLYTEKKQAVWIRCLKFLNGKLWNAIIPSKRNENCGKKKQDANENVSPLLIEISKH